jgi:uncharacterized protein YecE (DUF72 family)
MLRVGCSGFPVPATRYFREFVSGEVADTFVGVPGPVMVRRWKREAGPDYVFTALAPRDLTAELFKPTNAARAQWESCLSVYRDLGVAAVVVTSPADVPSSKATRAAAGGVLESLRKKGLVLAWEPPTSWELRDAEAIAKSAGALVVRDPTRHPPFAKVPLAYYRLPGPAGFKSRYEDPGIDAAAKTIRETRADTTLAIFANVDMYADAKRLKQSLER